MNGAELGPLLSMGHRAHPLLGQQVVDTHHEGRIGILRAVAPDVSVSQSGRFVPYADQRAARAIDDEQCVAWLAPPGGGGEWTTDVGAIEPAP